MTAEYRAGAVRQLRELISVQSSGLQHLDLQNPRIKRDESDVASMVDLLENNWTNPFGPDPSDLVNLSTGAAASPDVANDLLSSRKIGEEAYQNFQKKKLETGEGFYETLTKMKLKTFSNVNIKTLKGTNKEVILKADHRVFANMVLIAQNRKLDMRDVFCHPLGPLPWSLANADGTIKKTNKSVLASHLESKVQPAEQISGSCAALIDAMALIHKLSGENHTFDELSDRIFMSVLHAGYGCDRLDVVFDVYREHSIKSAERVNRGSQTGVMFIEIRPAHKIKNWKRLLASTETKNKLSKFLAESWKEEKIRAKLGERFMFVTLGEHCFKLTKDECEEIPALKSNQEEADTRLLLHAKHAAEHYPHILCIADDTDVFLVCLALSRHINSKIFIRRGTKARARLVDVAKLAAAVREEMCTALLGLHPWTGCDTVSALAGQGKMKALKILMRSPKFRNVFASLGTSWSLSDDAFNTIQEFTCQLYCSNTKVIKVNELRYQMFRARGGDVASGQLPPCADTLLQHTLRASYQAGIWRRSLENFPDIPSPDSGHGWTTKEGHLDIVWMKGSPAPEVVMSLMSCKCPRSCRPIDCTCILNKLKCTAVCKLQTCSDMVEDDDEEELLQNNEEDSCDSDA